MSAAVPRFVAVRRDRRVRGWTAAGPRAPLSDADLRLLFRLRLIGAMMLILWALCCAWLFSRAPVPDEFPLPRAVARVSCIPSPCGAAFVGAAPAICTRRQNS
jgi:hypothetical protein